MKKKVLGLFLVLMLVSFSAWGISDYATQSTTRTADAAISSVSGYLHGIVVTTDATNACTVDIYDNTAASGTKLIPTWIVPTSSTNRAQSYSISPPVKYDNGIYVDITVGGGGTCSYMVYYSNR